MNALERSHGLLTAEAIVRGLNLDSSAVLAPSRHLSLCDARDGWRAAAVELNNVDVTNNARGIWFWDEIPVELEVYARSTATDGLPGGHVLVGSPPHFLMERKRGFITIRGLTRPARVVERDRREWLDMLGLERRVYPIPIVEHGRDVGILKSVVQEIRPIEWRRR